jgi:predicted small lipoprotein YifL
LRQEEKDEQDSDYVSRYEMEILEQRIREEAREEANKSVMTMLGSLVAGMQGNLNIPTAQKQYEPHDDVNSEQTENDEDDEVVAAYAEKWMMDSIGNA